VKITNKFAINWQNLVVLLIPEPFQGMRTRKIWTEALRNSTGKISFNSSSAQV